MIDKRTVCHFSITRIFSEFDVIWYTPQLLEIVRLFPKTILMGMSLSTKSGSSKGRGIKDQRSEEVRTTKTGKQIVVSDPTQLMALVHKELQRSFVNILGGYLSKLLNEFTLK